MPCGKQLDTGRRAGWGERMLAERNRCMLPGCNQECQHFFSNALHIYHQRQLVFLHSVGAQGHLGRKRGYVAARNSQLSTRESQEPGAGAGAGVSTTSKCFARRLVCYREQVMLGGRARWMFSNAGLEI